MTRRARRPRRLGKAAVQASVGVGTFLVVIVAASPACWGPQDVGHYPSAGFVGPKSVFFRLGVKPRGVHDLRGNVKVGRYPTVDRHQLVAVAPCTFALYGGSSGALSEEIRRVGIPLSELRAAAATRVAVQRTCPVSPLSATGVLLHDEPTSFGGRQPFTSRAARWFITRFISARAKTSTGLKVEVEARSNREAVSGRFDTITLEFEELMFDNIQITGGAKLEMLGVDLLTPGLLPGPMRRLRRFRRPCEVTCVAEFTDEDLMFSPAIRRLAERVVNSALRPRKPARSPSLSERNGEETVETPIAHAHAGGDGGGGSGEQRVHVFRVRVHGRKLAVEGEMMSGPFFRVQFRYDISLSISRNGHVLNLKDPSVYWDTPGGHVPLPMLPQLQAMTIDLGDSARIEHLRISRGRLMVGGRFILSPVAPLTVSRGSKRANIEHDLAESLTRLVCKILRFNRD